MVGFLSVGGFVCCLTTLYLAMRGVMRLGGFVASGGPYAIAHPAPTWVWLFPASIFAGMFFIILNQINGRHIGGLNLLLLMWPLVFISLGYNFIDFAFHPPEGQTAVWAWLVCGVFFWLMGGAPVLLWIFSILRARRNRQFPSQTGPYRTTDPKRETNTGVIFVSLIAVICGIYLGIQLFRSVSN
jgi:hypothetical protein